MEVGKVAARVGIQGVVRRVRVQRHDLLVLVDGARLGARIRLRQRLHRAVHHRDAHPLAVLLPHDRSAMRVVHGERRVFHRAVRRLEGNDDALLDDRPLLSADDVEALAVLLDDRLEILVDVVNAAGRVHPAGLVVEALVDEELPPGERAVGVESFFAHHLGFRAEEERRVRIDEEHRVAAACDLRAERDAVRTAGLPGVGSRLVLPSAVSCGPGAIERAQVRDRHPLDVTADRAFAERQRHPWLEARDDARLHLGMRGEVEVQAVRPRVHEGLQPRGTLGVLRLQRVGADEELHAQIAEDLALPLGFGEPPHGVDEVRLDAIEVVLSLRVDDAEDRVRVRLAVDVRDTPIFADDRNVLRLPLPTRDIV